MPLIPLPHCLLTLTMPKKQARGIQQENPNPMLGCRYDLCACAPAFVWLKLMICMHTDGSISVKKRSNPMKF